MPTSSTSGLPDSLRLFLFVLVVGGVLATAVTIGSAMSDGKAEEGAGPTQSGPLVKVKSSLPVVGPESLMSKKAHGTCEKPVQAKLRWSVSRSKADQICCFNRHYAEHSGYWTTTAFLKEANRTGENFYDPVSGKLLFQAPRSRSWAAFVKESRAHGWPSFRDDEVNWENVRCLANGECVSVDGTHLGHNLPDRNGNRYCINLVSVAGYPTETKTKAAAPAPAAAAPAPAPADA